MNKRDIAEMMDLSCVRADSSLAEIGEAPGLAEGLEQRFSNGRGKGVAGQQLMRRPGDRFEHRCPFRIDVAAGRDSHTALNHRTEIGDDIAEHITGDDHIEVSGTAQQVHGGRIDQHVLQRHVRIVLADLHDDLAPEPGDREHVGLIDRSELAAAQTGRFERHARHALDLLDVRYLADGDGNLSILRNYAQGEDFILGTNADRAGQPGSSPGVDDINTTCAGNVATTVVPVEATDAMYGRVAIQGKPRLPSPDPADADGLMQVRAFTPTYDWVVGVGGPAPERRAVVDSGLCLDCHVGSLYQHGGNRVDNVDMCYLCHNTAANDEFVRVDSYGVDPSEAYDGRAGQNFGIKEMVHAVHPAGATGNPIVIYRGRGI